MEYEYDSINKNSKIYVSGHTGMVGSALVRQLKKNGYTNIIGKTHSELDLTRQADVEDFFKNERPEYVFMSAAKVGGIGESVKCPADYLITNLQIDCNIISSAFKTGVKKLLYVGSSCVYPCNAQQPMTEDMLLTGTLDCNNEGYAIAKIAGLKQCQFFSRQYGVDFISVMPCNLYGFNDTFEEGKAHIIPSMIKNFHKAKINNFDRVTIWGTGKAHRELLFADDVADGCIFVMNNYSGESFLNIGYGQDRTVLEIAETIKKVVGYNGDIFCDADKPEGAFRKLVDSSKINSLGWRPKTSLEEGIKMTYEWFLKNVENTPKYGGGVFNCCFNVLIIMFLCLWQFVEFKGAQQK